MTKSFDKTADCKPDSGYLLSLKRKEAGLSQKELADKAGISVETVCAYEQGKRDIMQAQYRIIKSLAGALECRPEDIA